ncbi:MAG: single-stranded DNA-binding protein [Betaproteobacteria bacterium]
MIDALISGKLYGAAQQRTGRNGKPFTTAKLRLTSGDGEQLFVNVITFAADAGAALMALNEGDAVAVAGTLTPRVWTDKQGTTRPALDVTATQVLTTYHVTRKRKAVADVPSHAQGDRFTGEREATNHYGYGGGA